MKDQEDYLDLEFDDDCYSTSWGIVNMWYQRAQKLRKLKEQAVKKKIIKKSQ